MIKFEKLTKSFGNLVVVDQLDLHIQEGEFLVLIGPSGCGKTTTLKMINRLVEPTSGSLFVKGRNIMEMNPVMLRREIGYVIQQIGLFPNMSIQENVDVVPRLLGWDKERRLKRVRELLELVDMDPDLYAHRYPNELSGGQQQRIGVLRALAAEPSIILMDEPFGALDPITRESLQDELKNLQSKLHKTIVFVTHDMDEALKLADRIVLMKDGKIVQLDTPDRLLRKPANDFVIDFIGKHRTNGQELQAVESIMNANPVLIGPEKGIAEAVALMKRKRVNTLLVVDNQQRLLGTVSVETLRDHKEANQVADLAYSKVPTVAAGSPSRDAFDLLVNQKLDYIPVEDAQRKVVGIVTRTSMVNALANVVWGEEESA
ncbi:ABC transporter ATP-binding protein [Desulforamulus ruminis]|uniref:Quaternary amine transport ATP-binding protein n=1 Tax=Desulforamulus ruminis (strain ATCC 23193 / DSM 2154 / NCIMB 8452 / DL) TaxID=696281 RepID=F6DUZ9_DESRL|nr:ABC transporter ATP-binding protein [Desulforamulus ruminis]AEG61396.1 glycine betaine/L-proline ABC transporter, ATPase subunit [Desulforamulus ruminis DSM 2154]